MSVDNLLYWNFFSEVNIDWNGEYASALMENYQKLMSASTYTHTSEAYAYWKQISHYWDYGSPASYYDPKSLYKWVGSSSHMSIVHDTILKQVSLNKENANSCVDSFEVFENMLIQQQLESKLSCQPA